jgi:hypothetical protein
VIRLVAINANGYSRTRRTCRDEKELAVPRLGIIREHQLEGFVLELAGKGLGCREIADQVGAERGISIGHDAVARFLREIREERGEVTNEIVQGYLRGEVPIDMALLEDVRDQLNLWRLDDRFKVSERLGVIRELRKVLELRLKLAGADDRDPVTDLSDMSDEELDALIRSIGEPDRRSHPPHVEPDDQAAS